MKNYLLLIVLLTIGFISRALYAQEITSDIFIIDSYVTPEQPYKIKISFMTTDSVKSKIIFNGNQIFKVSDNFLGTHKFEKNLSEIKSDSAKITYVIEITDSSGNSFLSEENELEIPANMLTESSSSGFLKLCLGASIFALPNPTLFITKQKNYFSLTKEIPLISFFSKGYNYPVGYFGVEYSYVNKFINNHFFRIGYKQVFQIPAIEYVSIGLNGFTNFNGKNGISPELTLGLVKFYNVFTLFTRYRLNVKPNESEYRFHELTIGLYSNILSLNF